SRVGVWEAAKWVAKVRDNACPKCCQSVTLKTNMSGGHFGEGGRFGQCGIEKGFVPIKHFQGCT
ncbi:hypothetical protein Q8G46_28400, partial [Klebsiella pneumoniae]|uniref:hypothetical protein n=1 Tax=Klebsiella pneumoniae TaxID=573 RepID=UPI003013243A